MDLAQEEKLESHNTSEKVDHELLKEEQKNEEAENIPKEVEGDVGGIMGDNKLKKYLLKRKNSNLRK